MLKRFVKEYAIYRLSNIHWVTKADYDKARAFFNDVMNKCDKGFITNDEALRAIMEYERL